MPRRPLSTSKPAESSKDAHAEADLSQEESSHYQETFKDKAGDIANKWLARNRNLVLRQTPVWAQTLAGLLIGLSTLAVVGGVVFRIDEVVTVQGQLKSIGGTVEVKTPAGGLVAEVLFKDGEVVNAGQLLMKFDTRQAADEKMTLTRLIDFEQKELLSRLKTLSSQKATLMGKNEVLDQKLNTKTTIISELQDLVKQGGFQRLQLLEQKDSLFELQRQINEKTQN